MGSRRGAEMDRHEEECDDERGGERMKEGSPVNKVDGMAVVDCSAACWMSEGRRRAVERERLRGGGGGGSGGGGVCGDGGGWRVHLIVRLLVRSGQVKSRTWRRSLFTIHEIQTDLIPSYGHQ